MELPPLSPPASPRGGGARPPRPSLRARCVVGRPSLDAGWALPPALAGSAASSTSTATSTTSTTTSTTASTSTSTGRRSSLRGGRVSFGGLSERDRRAGAGAGAGSAAAAAAAAGTAAGDAEDRLDRVLASIDRAQQARARLEEELAKLNTPEYMVLEAGAEALVLSAVLAEEASRVAEQLRGRVVAWVGDDAAERLQRFAAQLMERVPEPVARLLKGGKPGGGDAGGPAAALSKLQELQAELARLREEMQRAQGGVAPAPAPASAPAPEPSARRAGEAAPRAPSASGRPGPSSSEAAAAPPLPFNASMLNSVKLKRVSSSDGGDAPCTPSSKPPKASSTSSSTAGMSMQEVLQRAFEQKFKNARGSPDSAGKKSLSMDTENSEPSPFDAPPVPPRPALKRGASARGSASAAGGKVSSAAPQQAPGAPQPAAAPGPAPPGVLSARNR